MFGKISKRYYKDENKFGPRILAGSIVFVLVAMAIGSFTSFALKSNEKYELEIAHRAFKGCLPKEYSYDSIKYIGSRTWDPLNYASMDKHMYKVYGLKDEAGRRVPGEDYLLYTSHDFNGPLFIYIVAVNTEISDYKL